MSERGEILLCFCCMTHTAAAFCIWIWIHFRVFGPGGDVPSVDVDTAKDLLSSGHHFLDVRLDPGNHFQLHQPSIVLQSRTDWSIDFVCRTTKEFNESHVRGALNVPYLFITQDGNFEFIILPNFQNPEDTNTVLDASYIVSPGNVSRKQFVVSDFLAILPGRVKNPEFLTHVASVCNKEDHIIVVRCVVRLFFCLLIK